MSVVGPASPLATSPNGAGPEAGAVEATLWIRADALEALVGALVEQAVGERVEVALARIEAGGEEAWAKVRKLGIALTRTDEERKDLRDQYRQLEAERASLERERRRCVHERAALEQRRRELSRLMAAASRTPDKGSPAQPGGVRG